MAATLVVGDEAPNFDLTSTEDVVLMLCDEVPRMAVLLYFSGVVFGREVEFLNGTTDFDIDSGFIARAGLHF